MIVFLMELQDLPSIVGSQHGIYGNTAFGKWVFPPLPLYFPGPPIARGFGFSGEPPNPAGFGKLSESHCSAETCVPHVVIFKPR